MDGTVPWFRIVIGMEEEGEGEKEEDCQHYYHQLKLL